MNAQLAIRVLPEHLNNARKLWQLIMRDPGRKSGAEGISGNWWECTWDNGKLTIQRHLIPPPCTTSPRTMNDMPTIGPPVIECDGTSITVNGWSEGATKVDEALDIAIDIAKCLKAHGLKSKLGWRHVNIEGSPNVIKILKAKVEYDLYFPEPHFDSSSA